MKEYKVQKGDTLLSLSQKLGLPTAYSLKEFHNFKGPIDRGIGNEIKPGMILTIPEQHEVDNMNAVYTRRVQEREAAQKEKEENEKSKVPLSENTTQDSEQKSEDKEKEKKDAEEKPAGEHDGKLFVIQKGKAICDKGTKFPQFKVSSHKKHYLNNESNSDDFLAVTENDLQFNPPAVPFGNCSLKNNQPCSFAPVGKWTKFYKDVKVLDNALLTEISELQCAIGGKIKIMDHGQRAQLSKQNFKNADARVHSYINPLVDLRMLNEQLDEEELDAY
ncbi:PAAR-like protein [Chryseobacterium sp. JUb7]|uniref:DUF4280 and LysM peptidoglycan-binding domain-containing protein n=1 Tax=Chryseobacterium sp. JUb7 TaxID=2940599 RepID=UPI0021676581|nr:PAAR-like protein [Chryseobacterium sp. JUb7]MCS3532584.1 hypothetical protein [Chryseobacterium sp. JUb7]